MVGLVLTYHGLHKHLTDSEDVTEIDPDDTLHDEALSQSGRSNVTGSQSYIESNLEVELEWRKQFYALYTSKFEVIKNSTLIKDDKYAEIVSVLFDLSTCAKKQPKTKFERDCQTKYLLVGNIEKRCLHRKIPQSIETVRMTTFKEVFDAMSTIRYRLGHPRDFRKNKVALDKKNSKFQKSASAYFCNYVPFAFLVSDEPQSIECHFE
jgi:hypothetical protein